MSVSEEGALVIRVENLTGFPSKLEPYLIIHFDGRYYRSHVLKCINGKIYFVKEDSKTIMFPCHSLANLRVEIWDHHRFQKDRLVGVGNIFHHAELNGELAINLVEPYRSWAAAERTSQVLNSSLGFQAIQPRLAVSLSFNTKNVFLRHSTNWPKRGGPYVPTPKERAYVEEMESKKFDSIHDFLQDKQEKKRKVARCLAKHSARIDKLKPAEKERLSIELSSFYASLSGATQVELSKEAASYVYSTWKLIQQEHIACSSRQPVLPDDCCYVCQDGSVGWSDPFLHLRCRHYLHQSCAEMQMKQASGSLALSFTPFKCGICRQWLEHKNLNAFVSPQVELYSRVAQMAKRQWQLEEQGSDRLFLTSTGEIVSKMVFRRCRQCQQPYYAGRVECNGQNFEEAEVEFPAGVELCADCAQIKTDTCVKHGTADIQWKCLWCCNAATYNCGGSAYYCTPCHDGGGPPDWASVRHICKGPPSCDGLHPPNDGQTPFALGCGICRPETSQSHTPPRIVVLPNPVALPNVVDPPNDNQVYAIVDPIDDVDPNVEHKLASSDELDAPLDDAENHAIPQVNDPTYGYQPHESMLMDEVPQLSEPHGLPSTSMEPPQSIEAQETSIIEILPEESLDQRPDPIDLFPESMFLEKPSHQEPVIQDSEKDSEIFVIERSLACAGRYDINC